MEAIVVKYSLRHLKSSHQEQIKAIFAILYAICDLSLRDFRSSHREHLRSASTAAPLEFWDSASGRPPARLILSLYSDDATPVKEIHDWELDPSVIAIACEFFGLAKLERQHQGRLLVYIGGALEAKVEGGFTSILVDLFSKGSMIAELQDLKTWKKLRSRLQIILQRGDAITVRSYAKDALPSNLPSLKGDGNW
ncbi:hypothetical protein Cni_G07117 [Canna indica]|uniref:Uncharacterized protein n=1 Tax=Canna indica TaxID=4628 RepID=A0AAQ3JYJ6_9LILI|nr:hypothetical protein Cni_G07117 [Canna indica]